jgi:hypothetical protein
MMIINLWFNKVIREVVCLLIYYLYIYIANIWSSHVHRKFLEIATLIGEKRKKN